MAIREIDAATARDWIAAGDTVLIDVREPGEHARESIPGAHLMPLAQINPDKIAALGTSRVILHCASGMRSARAAGELPPGACEIVSLRGGLSAWRQAGGPVRENRNAPIPIQRQVMIVAGSLVVLGVALGAMINPWFYLLAGFVGAGLTFAGLTGICAMATLLAKLPYNRVARSPS